MDIKKEKEIKKFLLALEVINTETPQTIAFENEYGQAKNDRWWEQLQLKDDNKKCSRQKYHIYGTFRCAAYHDGIINPKCKTAKECKECYENGFDRFTNNFLSESNLNDNFLQTKFNGMGRPEMYLWFVEAFELLENEKLDKCFSDVEKLCKNNSELKGPSLAKLTRELLTNNYDITWDTVAEKANEIVNIIKIK